MSNKRKNQIVIQACNVVLQGPKTGMTPEELAASLALALAILNIDEDLDTLHEYVDAAYHDLKDMEKMIEYKDMLTSSKPSGVN